MSKDSKIKHMTKLATQIADPESTLQETTSMRVLLPSGNTVVCAFEVKDGNGREGPFVEDDFKHLRKVLKAMIKAVR